MGGVESRGAGGGRETRQVGTHAHTSLHLRAAGSAVSGRDGLTSPLRENQASLPLVGET